MGHQPFPFAVVSLGLMVSALTAPVTHQDLGRSEQRSSLCDPCPVSRDPENLRFQAVSKMLFTGLMVFGQPLVAHGVGSQEVDELWNRGWNGYQSGFMASAPTFTLVPRSSPLLIRIISPVEKARDPS